MITIKKNSYDFYEVRCGNGSVVLQKDFDKAIDLCRLRLGTTLQENNITIVKIPFINFWIIF